MIRLTEPERALLERLAVEGKATRLDQADMPAAKSLEGVGLLFLVCRGEMHAVISPKGRHLLLAYENQPPRPPKPPFGFLD